MSGRAGGVRGRSRGSIGVRARERLHDRAVRVALPPAGVALAAHLAIALGCVLERPAGDLPGRVLKAPGSVDLILLDGSPPQADVLCSAALASEARQGSTAVAVAVYAVYAISSLAPLPTSARH